MPGYSSMDIIIPVARTFNHEHCGNTGGDPKASLAGSAALLDRLMEIEDETESLEAMRCVADETF